MKSVLVLASLAVAAALIWQSELASSAGHKNAAESRPKSNAACGVQDKQVSPADGRLTGMVLIPGGRFTPGSRQGYADERPAGEVRVKGFWMDRTEVTNARFAEFVRATGHVTVAERQGWSVVFRELTDSQDGNWWHVERGANWRHPEGPQSDVRGRESEPVVHVALADALAYARWLGHDLPTENEWEYAARANGKQELLDRAPVDAQGRPAANFWQGMFPYLNTREDGYAGRSPVGCYAANGFGLYDMIGNVWEWTLDAYVGVRQPHGSGDPVDALPSKSESTSARSAVKVIKGGSFLCAPDFCARYRASARHPQEADLPVAHVGFRTVLHLP